MTTLSVNDSSLQFQAMPSDKLTVELLRNAQELCMHSEHSIISALIEITGWDNIQLMKILADNFAYPLMDMYSLQTLQAHFSTISYAQCSERGLVLASDVNKQFYLVLANPFDTYTEQWAINQLQQKGIRAEIVLSHPDDLSAYLLQQEQQLRAINEFTFDESIRSDENLAAVITLASINDDHSPVVKLVNSTIYDALKMHASDIHLECDAGCLYVLYRIDGVLVPITQAQGQEIAEQIISRIKVMAELDIAEHRVPQDGRFKVRINEREIDFRVSIMPNIFGEDAVLRLLDRQSLTEEARALHLNHLGLDEHSIAVIRQLAKKPHGMLLVTGPTGSGKTTTLYAAITEIHNGSDKIITIEDPVEYRLPRVLQIPVNEKKGLTFAKGLRSILRHDPDKIMVGEIRDQETAQIAVQAALTGHLVFTSVHANNVFDVLGRFLHMGVDGYSFAAALNGIVAQRLLRINCTHCSKDSTPNEAELTALNLTVDDVKDWKFKAGSGCGHCRGVGYKGRKAVAEVLILDDGLRELIAERAPISQLKERAQQQGLRPLVGSALKFVAQGETTLAEVLRVVG